MGSRKGKQYLIKETLGKVVERKEGGLDHSTAVKVEYCVDGEVFTIKETLKMTSKIIKLWGFLPIGQEKTLKVNCKPGDTVAVIYDEKSPHKGQIKGNDGWITS